MKQGAANFKNSSPNYLSLGDSYTVTVTSMTKDHHDNILQEGPQKLEEQQPEEQQEEGGLEKDAVKEEEEEEEERGLAPREAVEEEEGCKTPTSSEHKIPIIQSCPPTPKKKVRVNLFHKRKLSELQFFETTRKKEVESFFRSNSETFAVDGCRSFKRRCRSA